MGDRYEEIREIAESLRSGNFEKIACDDTIKKEAQDPMAMGAPMDSMAAGGMPPGGMVPPEALPPAGMGGAEAVPSSEAVAAQGMTEVSLRALDLTQGVIEEALGSDTLTPANQLDATAAALETSGALDGIPPEELEALAQQPPPPPVQV